MAIFEFSREDWIYKGVLWAQGDLVEMKKMGLCPAPPGFYVGILAFIWVDEKGNWFHKGRLVFPSGNKISFSREFGTDCNETKVLTDLYRFPMTDKLWIPNKDGTLKGLVKIMQDTDIVGSIVVIKND